MSQNTSAEKKLINSNVVFVDHEMLMQDVVKLMIDSNISSVLVTDQTSHVVGILTERDIVRKFTLLEMTDKLTRTVATLMTRSVRFVHVKTLKQDITKLHLEHKIRHFPVLNGTDPKKDNILGIVSITDLARQSLLAQSSPSEDTQLEPHKIKLELGVMASHKGVTATYIDLFKGMGFEATDVKDLHGFFAFPKSERQALVLDLDGFTDRQQHDLIPIAVKSKAYLILTTSNPNLVSVFKKYLSKDRQEIAIKPLDMSYISWMLSKKWSA